MSTKTKKDSPSSKKTVKKTVAKKTATPKKKTAAKKKPAAKKTIVKKSVSEPTTKKKATKNADEPVVVLKFDAKTEPVVQIHRKYILVGTCKSCNHMPMSANKLVAVLSIAIAILSGLLISTSLPTNFEMPSISMSDLTEWITPASNVSNNL